MSRYQDIQFLWFEGLSQGIVFVIEGFSKVWQSQTNNSMAIIILSHQMQQIHDSIDCYPGLESIYQVAVVNDSLDD